MPNRDAAPGKFRHLELHRRRVRRTACTDGDLHGPGTTTVVPVLVARGHMAAADHDRLGPDRHQRGHVRMMDRLAEDHAAEDVADRSGWALHNS